MKRGGWLSRLRGRPNGTDPFAEMPGPPRGATTAINSSPVGVPVAAAPSSPLAQGGHGAQAGPNGHGMPPAQAATAPPGPAEARPPEPPAPPPPGRESVRAAGPWAGLCDHFGVQVLLLAEQLRPALDRLEEDEQDPERLERLYQVDHAITRMRRCARDLRVLSGRGDDTEGTTSSLVDTIRVAQSAIERYTQVSIGAVAELAVVGYVADDVSSLLAALLDNATRYSPSTVTVSGHLLPEGGVMFRIEDGGIGLTGPHVAALNAVLDSEVPEMDDHTARHTGFAIVHRLARKHGIRVRLAARAAPAGTPGGTTAMVTVPPSLLTEIPDPPLAMAPAAPEPADPVPDPSATAHLTRPQPARRGHVAAVPDSATPDSATPDIDADIDGVLPGDGTPAPDASGPDAGSPAAFAPAADGPVTPGAAPGAAEYEGEHAPPRHAAPGPETLPPLPRREPTSLRGGDDPGWPPATPPPAEPDEQVAAEARRSFADDVAAFTGAFTTIPTPEDTGLAEDVAPSEDLAATDDTALDGDRAWPESAASPEGLGRDLASSEDETPVGGFAPVGEPEEPLGAGFEDVDHVDDIGPEPPGVSRSANPPDSGEQVP